MQEGELESVSWSTRRGVSHFGSRYKKESSSRSAGPLVEELVVLAQGTRRRARAGQPAEGVKMDVEQAQLASVSSGFRIRRHT